MDFRLTPEEEKLRAEVRGFLKESLPAEGVATTLSWQGLDGGEEAWEFAVQFNKKLAQRGWIAPAWAKKYGGLEASYIEQLIFSEELAYHRAPNGGRIFSVDMIGPILIIHGTDEQREQHLPGIAQGDAVWCQGYSEPGAGSDLASIQTRAVRDGDEYVINGQKIWTTLAHRADWIFLVARTDPDAPKHKGISFFLADMKTPGMTVRPILNIASAHEFNEVYFENVRVPVTNRVGAENQGWYVAMALLDFERSSVGSVASGRRTLGDLIAYVREKDQGIAGRSPQVRHGLADMWTACETGRIMSYRIAWMQQAGQTPNREASMAKVFATELNQRLYDFAVNMLGMYGQLEPGSEWAPMRGRIEREFLENVAPTIYSGTSEIQRNIIATRGLGLPR